MQGFKDVEGFREAELDFLDAPARKAVWRAMGEIAEPEIPNSPLYIGKRLDELNVILAPYGYFTTALGVLRVSDNVPKTLRTVYGYMYGYRNAAQQLPEGAVAAMMERKLIVSTTKKGLGDWTEAIAAVPPPATGTSAAYLKWVDKMIESKPKRMTGALANLVPRDPDEVLLECYRAIERLGKRLPVSARERCVRRLIGYTMTHFGLKSEKFVPAEIPPNFQPARRRYRAAA